MKNVLLALVLLASTGCFKPYVPPSMRSKASSPSKASSEPAPSSLKTDETGGDDGAKTADDGPKRDPEEIAQERMRRQEAADDEAAAEAEEPIYMKAMEQCANTRPACTRKCEGGDNMTCLAVALNLANTTPPDFKESVRLADKACSSGKSKAACIKLEHIRESETKYARELDGGWSTLAGIGDDLATKKFLHAFASTQLTGRRNAVAAGRMQQHIQAITAESFCPAKKEFVAAAGSADFARRSKKHCSEEPPTATGLSGEEQTLTAECTAVYATPCP